ncbi:hypothetical protein Taro_046478, partial [Colocasia esculenta]|nr:hypothetical protein [Colocasia esculenta]
MEVWTRVEGKTSVDPPDRCDFSAAAGCTSSRGDGAVIVLPVAGSGFPSISCASPSGYGAWSTIGLHSRRWLSSGSGSSEALDIFWSFCASSGIRLGSVYASFFYGS